MLLMAMPGPGTHTHTHTLKTWIGFLIPNTCFKTTKEHTGVKSQFLPAVCMLLLCRQQPPDIPNYNPAVVDLKDEATPTAGESNARQSQKGNSNHSTVHLDRAQTY